MIIFSFLFPGDGNFCCAPLVAQKVFTLDVADWIGVQWSGTVRTAVYSNPDKIVHHEQLDLLHCQ